MKTLCKYKNFQNIRKVQWFHLSPTAMNCVASNFTEIKDIPSTPICMFNTEILKHVDKGRITMNLAMTDNEYGVLSTVMTYKGFIDDSVPMVMDRKSHKFKNMKRNPIVGLTFLQLVNGYLWQIRLFDAKAEELTDEQINAFWVKEEPFSKIRAHLKGCGITCRDELQEKYNKMLQELECGGAASKKPDTYTAIKVTANRWEFYKGQKGKIGDRVEYCLGNDNEWKYFRAGP